MKLSLAKDHNLYPSELKIPKKKRSNSAVVFSRLVYVDVRTLGLGIGKCVCFGAEPCL